MGRLPCVLWALCVYAVGRVEGDADRSPSVATPSGRIVGSLMTSRRGRPIRAYRGIRYAQPPVGELRFRPPLLITEYEGEVDATEEGPACPQDAQPGYLLDEDCLRLNVYTPGDRDGSPLLPVFVYIHAGGWYSGSGRSDVAGPHYLLDKDLLLVTVNYRLGSLGFLSTGDAEAPGNNGFKDQVAALRWVKRHIASFGGDPNTVTVAGYSAGSMSVALHLVSPMSKGLFHRAVAMSGSPYSQVPLKRDLLSLASRQARLVDCPETSTRELVACLRTVPWRKLGDSLRGFRDFSIDPILIWTPVVEGDFGQERFLLEDPMSSMRELRVNPVPLIVSQTRDEFFWEAFLVLNNPIYTSLMNSEWERVAPLAFLLPAPSDRAASVLRDFYLKNRTLSNKTEDARDLGRLYGDGVIGFGVHRLVNILSHRHRSSTYRFVFDYIGNRSHYEDPHTGKPAGVAHHDELIYLFSLRLAFEDIPPSGSQDSAMVDKLTAVMHNFALSGDPNPLFGESAPAWGAFSPHTKTHLSISQSYSVGRNYSEDRYRVWEQLYPCDYSSLVDP